MKLGQIFFDGIMDWMSGEVMESYGKWRKLGKIENRMNEDEDLLIYYRK